MKLLKNKKFMFNLILLVVSVLPFFVLIGSLVQLDVKDAINFSFYNFLEKELSFVGNFGYIFLISHNVLLIIFNFVYPFFKKTTRLIVFVSLGISGLLNIGIIVYSFFIGAINNIDKYISFVPMMVVMIGFLSLVFLAVRFVMELKIDE